MTPWILSLLLVLIALASCREMALLVFAAVDGGPRSERSRRLLGGVAVMASLALFLALAVVMLVLYSGALRAT